MNNQPYPFIEPHFPMKANNQPYPFTEPHFPMTQKVHMAAAMPALTPQHLVMQLRPLIRYGLKEAQYTSIKHSMTEVALIAYLVGMGYDYGVAHRIVESWEIDEVFPGE